MILENVNADKAREILTQNGGKLRDAIRRRP
jgi:N-acetylmuramic acid 6-phosphate (MurNAc-6-P) etherase